MRILVTGARGFIGAAFARTAVAQGHEVIAVDRSTEGRELPDEVEMIEGDITRPAAWRSAFRGVELVVHSAAMHRSNDIASGPIRSIEVNLHGTRLMLDTAAASHVGCFINLSSAKAYGEPLAFPSSEGVLLNPVEPYGLAKTLGEEYCRYYAARSAMKCVSVRPFSVYGPDQDLSTGYVGQLIEAWLTGRPATLSGHPSFLRDFVHIDDVVGVCLGAAHPSFVHDVVNAGSGQATSLQTLVAEFAALCGESIDVDYAPAGNGTIERTLADITLTLQALGRRPVPFHAGLRETIAWFESRRSVLV
jgi:UDP-glucose 4-epimerase